MKYLTKEWYRTMQKTDMYLPLKISKNAETFSEKYYINLYKKEEKKWVKMQEEVSKVTFEDAFPQYADITLLSQEECKEREKFLVKFNERPAFNLIQAKEHFKQLQENNIKRLKSNLPTEILNKIADIRVLALDRTSYVIKKTITDYCKEQNMKVQKTLRDYQQCYYKELKDCKNKAIQKLNLHDSLIINIIKEKDKLIIELDCSGSFADIKNIIFKDYKIIEEEMNFINGWCLYEEIYIIDNIYELHLLIDVPKNNEANLGYFTIRAENLTFKK